MDENKNMKIIVEDLIKEECSEMLFEVLFESEKGINMSKMIDFMIERFNVYKNEYSLSEQNEIVNYIDCVRKSQKMFDEFIMEIKESLTEQYEFDAGEIGKLDYNRFWHMYAVAIKKCTGMRNDVLDENEYFKDEYLKKVKEITPRQKMAHRACIQGYAYDSNKISKKDHPELNLFMHEIHIRSRKKMAAKRYIERVWKRTKKLMQIYKIRCRFDEYNFFKGKCEKVPYDFAKVIKRRLK